MAETPIPASAPLQDRLECEHVIIAMGNHDAYNVGYRYFENLFGLREGARTVPLPQGEAKVTVLGSSKPDMDEAEGGREHYGWLDSELRDWDQGPKIAMIHHHLLAVPGTGRDTNILRDAGDVTSILTELSVDLVLCVHRHVPHARDISGMRVIHSGTASSERLRGNFGPLYSTMEFGPEEVRIEFRKPGDHKEPLARFDRGIAKTREHDPDFERYVRYAELPF